MKDPSYVLVVGADTALLSLELALEPQRNPMKMQGLIPWIQM